jgi:hypothetical protein
MDVYVHSAPTGVWYALDLYIHSAVTQSLGKMLNYLNLSKGNACPGVRNSSYDKEAARTRQQGQDSKDGQDSKNKTERTRQQGKDSKYKTARTTKQ